MITVYTGPMGCGKTQKLIQIYNENKFKTNCVMLKSDIDNRYAKNHVVSRNNNKVECYNIHKLYDLSRFSFTNNLIFIDEFQFIGGDIDILRQLSDDGKHIFISGLNLTSERRPFGLMGDVMCIADEVIFLTTKCQRCSKNTAKYTYCKDNKTEEILIGDSNYMSVCPKCYNVLKQVRS